MWLLIPVKQFTEAKSRLRSVLNPAERELLFEAMFRDVLAAASQARGYDGMAIITCSQRAAEFARSAAIEVLNDDQICGHKEAVAEAAKKLTQRGANGLVTIPADVPSVATSEIERIASIHRERRELVLVPSRDRLGTNGLAVSPPDAIGFCFGHDSFAAHLAEAKNRNLRVKVLELAGLGLDIDTPDDLRRLLKVGGGHHTTRFLQASGIAERLAHGEDRDDPISLEPSVVGR